MTISVLTVITDIGVHWSLLCARRDPRGQGAPSPLPLPLSEGTCRSPTVSLPAPPAFPPQTAGPRAPPAPQPLRLRFSGRSLRSWSALAFAARAPRSPVPHDRVSLHGARPQTGNEGHRALGSVRFGRQGAGGRSHFWMSSLKVLRAPARPTAPSICFCGGTSRSEDPVGDVDGSRRSLLERRAPAPC